MCVGGGGGGGENQADDAAIDTCHSQASWHCTVAGCAKLKHSM